MTIERELSDAGFSPGGWNESGETFWTRTGSDGRVLVVSGDCGWGADVYPTESAYVNGTDREPFPGTYSTPDGLLADLRDAGLLTGQPNPERCPGCGCEPGDGLTDGCNETNGCGFYRGVNQ